YLALSYVWGEAQPHSTTERNVDAYTSTGIDPSLLPKTIRDAIRVTHALGFQYLWADCLCIIQDSDEDKRHELACMHYIYRYAHLTIIAASARTVSEGFLQDRPAPPRDIALPFICPPPLSSSGESIAGEVHVSQTWTRRADHPPYHRHWDPISARGWCMQEYFMSPRALIFTSETLRFMCPSVTQNVGTTHYKPCGERRLPSMLFLPDPPALEHGSEKWAKLYRGWCHIAEDYSQRTIGRASDKLVACGAIAEAFARVLDSDYLAGLWRATLLQDVLWRRASLGTYLHRPVGYRAPSWSWAAVDGRVRTLWGSPLEWIAVAEVVRCEVVLEHPKLRFGQVTGGVLVVHAPLVECKLRPNGKSHDVLLSTASSWHVSNWGDGGLDEEEEAALNWAYSGWGKIDCATALLSLVPPSRSVFPRLAFGAAGRGGPPSAIPSGISQPMEVQRQC
ncbi:HET-domain-containing protein, partial [Trametes versicolor FP-101664 SS1]|uniref:HET-domain-containing protein n=1 Tax=Trametes versicolor (strain FP-101664) TaxID=717944 RepID=UPI0004623C30